MPHTKGFFNHRQLVRHCALHRADFGIEDEADYQAMADAFIGGAMRSGVLQCTRASTLDIIRFDPATQEYAVATKDLIILTYYKARPCSSLPHWEHKVNCHGEPDNMTYFRKECAK